MTRILLAHITFSVFISAILSFVFGSLSPIISIVSLLMGSVVSLLVYKYIRSENEPKIKIKSFFDGVLMFTVLLFVLRQFGYLLFETEKSLKTLNASNFGDLSLHIGIIKNLSAGGKFWPDFVSFAQSKLQYPFAMDLYNALWDSVQVPLQSHLFVSGVVLSCAVIISLYWWLGALGIVALFFNGGVLGFEFLSSGIALNYQADVAWKNFFLSLIIPQRGFLMAFPLGIYLLKKYMDRCYFNYNFVKYEKTFLAFLWGMLPFFHLHTFLIVSLFLGLFSFQSKCFKNDFKILFISVPLALMWILPMTDFFKKGSIVHFQWGWHLNEFKIHEYLFFNYGPWLILFILSAYLIFMRGDKSYKFIFGTAFLLMLCFQFVMLAPWDWDNVKVLVWCYLVMVFGFKYVIDKYIQKSVHVFIYGVLGFSGFICVVGYSNVTNKGHAIYNVIEINNIQSSILKTPADAVFVAAPVVNHALTYFGRKVVLGYEGHVWSHGFSAAALKDQIEKVLRGDPNAVQIARDLNATHIYIGEKEFKKYNPNLASFEKLKNISSVSGVYIYEIN